MKTEPRHNLFRDRISGHPAKTAPISGTLVGRWVIDTGSHYVFMNSASAKEGDFLVPEPSGHWEVLADDGLRHTGTVARSQAPDDLEAESVRTIGDKLENLALQGASWLQWIDVVPLVPGISEKVDPQPLELLVRKDFGQLEAVCRKPRTHLHIEVERVPVSQARRIPPVAASYLAAHTEDWDQPLIRSILPKRILAEVRNDQFDIYENRVTARLLDNLSTYFNRRIRELRRLLNMFQQKEDYSGSVGGTYPRVRRISSLWGKLIDANEGRKKAEAALRKLENVKYNVLGLLGSPLYERVPRRAFVPTTLKTTNILTNDQHYRRVAGIWREWAKTGASRTRSPSELHAEAQRLCRGLDSFAMLLTARALDTLGYVPTEAGIEMPLVRGGSLPVRGHGVDLELSWHPNGTISIALGKRELIIVTVAMDLRAGPNEQVRESLRQIHEGILGREFGAVLVLFLAPDDERASVDSELLDSLQTVGNDPRNTIAIGGCLPVSPWEIGSTERVGRALRWFLSSARFVDYPQRVSIPQAARGTIEVKEHTRWLESKDGGATLEFRTPPHAFEWALLNLTETKRKVAADLKAARSARLRISDELRQALSDRRTGALNQQKHAALEEERRCECVEKAVDELANALDEAHAKSVALLVCPTCRTIADPARDFESRDQDCFRCSCEGCRTKWETRLCSKGHRYAAMLPSGEFVDTDDQRSGWEDRIYGCDILALPARKGDGRWGFVCPECGLVS